MESFTQPKFQRPRFDPLGQELSDEVNHDSIRSLPDLIYFNAETNPDRIFCVQAEAKPTNYSGTQGATEYNAVQITFKELSAAVNSCSSWLEKSFVNPEHVSINGGELRQKAPPVALYLESDVGLFIYLAALLASNIPAVLLSARLSTESVRHLLKETGAQSLLLSKKTDRLIAQDVADLVRIKVASPYSSFLEPSILPASTNGAYQCTRQNVDENDVNVLILHSSGTTGLPKPIHLAHRYTLGYAACHKFAKDESIDWPNLSTLPLYHGFGLLAPCLSLSVGMHCIFPPSSIIPAAHSTMALLSTFGVQSIMTVPSILEEIVNLPSTEWIKALSLLRSMHFIAVGGGPLNPDVGAMLVSDGVKILNHYGVTEIGAIAPIFQPTPDYDHRYLRLRTDLGLQLRPVTTTEGKPGQRFKLVGFPFGWDRPFEIQDEIVKRPDSQYLEVKILGRLDDVIVLKNGEKVIPQNLEQALSQDTWIKTAVCVGQGYFEIALLIEPSSLAPTDEKAFVDHVWKLVSELNPTLDQHAQIASKRAIIVKPFDKTIPRSDKGSIMRRELHTVFQAEINATYEALELESLNTEVSFNPSHLESSLRDLVELVMNAKWMKEGGWKTDDDFFELGMDSLKATRLVRFLSSSIEKACPGAISDERLTPAFIYRNPSLKKLTRGVDQILRGEPGTQQDATHRGPEIQSLAEEYIQALDEDEFKVDNYLSDSVVLMTGTTGNLGAHMLGCLARSDRVARIICLNRSTKGTDDDFRARQEHSNRAAGVTLSSSAWNKVSILAANMQAPDLGLTAEQLTELRNTVTHIVHLAWPMDFNRPLQSFRPQLNFLKALIHLSRSAHEVRPHVRPRIMFASSISVVRYHRELAGESTVYEKHVDDPCMTTRMGYAEAKWICERMLQYIGEKWPQECTPMIVRIGQLSGPEYNDGVWKTEEHIPALIKASQMVSAFPELSGDFSWLPVDRAACALLDILFQTNPTAESVYHLENPIRQPLSVLGTLVVDELKLTDTFLPFQAWLERVASNGYATSLLEFFRNDFQALANGDVVLDTRVTRGASTHLRGSDGISKNLIVEYLWRWKKSGFLVTQQS